MYLSLLTFFPLLGALVVLALFKRDQGDAIKKFATVWALAELVLSIPLLCAVFGCKSFMGLDFTPVAHLPGIAADSALNGTLKYRLIESVEWIKPLGVTYQMGVDATSILLILLTNLISFLSLLSSWTAVHDREKEYYTWLLVLHAGMVGVFCALDMFLFYVFWEVMLVPMYFLIGIWGGERRLYSAIKFFLYTLAGSVLMLVAILAVYFKTGTPDAHTFNYFAWLETLQRGAGFSDSALMWLFAAFAVAFAIKVPMFPVHTWLPDAHTDAPTAGSVILAGVLLKMGSYGFIRFNLPFFPTATVSALPVLIGICVVGIIYGALCAMVQTDWKRLVAYSSVSHMGFVMLGLFWLNLVGFKGGVLQMVNHGISTGALFLLVGIIYEQRHTRLISEYGGLSAKVPAYATIFMIMTMSSIGLPLLNGFSGEFPILAGAFQMNGAFTTLFGVPYLLPILAVTGVVLGAAYMLWLYQRTMFGPLSNPANNALKDLSGREWAYLLPLVLLAFYLGIFPSKVFTFMEPDLQANVLSFTDKAMEPYPTVVAQRMAALAAGGEHAGAPEGAAAPAGEAAPALETAPGEPAAPGGSAPAGEPAPSIPAPAAETPTPVAAPAH